MASLDRSPSAQNAHPRILLVESDPALRTMLGRTLGEWGWEVAAAEDLQTAIRGILSRGPFDLMVCDQELPDGSGMVLLRWVRDQVIATPFVLLSGAAAPLPKSSARFGCLLKPIELAQLHGTLSQMLARSRSDEAPAPARADAPGRSERFENGDGLERPRGGRRW